MLSEMFVTVMSSRWQLVEPLESGDLSVQEESQVLTAATVAKAMETPGAVESMENTGTVESMENTGTVKAIGSDGTMEAEAGVIYV